MWIPTRPLSGPAGRCSNMHATCDYKAIKEVVVRSVRERQLEAREKNARELEESSAQMNSFLSLLLQLRV